MTMVAAFQCLLYERSGDSDIAIGSCAANRLLVHVEGVIGRFANDLVLRTDMAGCPTFRELLARVRQTALTAFSYQDLPFGTLMLELGPSYTSGQQPIFQVMFILQDAPKTRPEITGLTLSCFPVQLGMAKYDLTVWLRPLGLREELEFVFEYSADLFEPTTMEHMLDRYQWLLESVSKDPGMPINAYI
jgi:non-ribosomal peptide synthetase component F